MEEQNRERTSTRPRIRVVFVVTALVLAVGVAGGAYYLGFSRGSAQTKNISIQGISGGETPSNVSADFSLFWQAWNELKSKQINSKNTDDQNMLYGAISGLAGAFGDPYTVFFNPKDADKFNSDIQGSFGGIGAELGSKDHQIIIIAPLKNTPAERAGLKPQDAILEVDGVSIAGLTIDQTVQKIRGDAGTKVTLTIMRDGWDSSKKFEITREIINVPTVDWSMKNGDVIYLQLYNFNAQAESLFYNAMLNGLMKGGKGLVLDLRNNPGGYLDEAVNLAGWFVDRGSVVVKERYADGHEQVLRTNGNQALKGFPVVVLVNEGSASASEILAGALRVDRGIKLVGVKTFGKGTVQEVDSLKDGSTLKITTANWLLPDGTLIDKNGLNPDYEVKLTDDDIKAKRDPQLDKALEVLRAEINK
ncbi:MAG: hypothetical protein CO020_00995 [Candidatus Colwellbacteria bacterium CG_4_9_14_0_2_um_filter_50_12]|uniref:PDZ domain-containing protein n=1 Tax=Candidatus Colwellbacteria bacterium CG_4_9_14_0_2_um_filter_50_12 TaxID=1974538 RepID=A0A2M8G191_9BACT|nr:MAG: hypothetical protein CO020_00995 [Candidatus Colwellbacteria bacterium CG_4_9_14_0_2_um_filter_50_12]